MSNTAFISDLHLDHPKALQVRGWFPTLKEYQEYVCDIWVDKVTPRTTIYLLGDIAFTWEGLGILKKLPGKKLLNVDLELIRSGEYRTWRDNK